LKPTAQGEPAQKHRFISKQEMQPRHVRMALPEVKGCLTRGARGFANSINKGRQDSIFQHPAIRVVYQAPD
jgi:hypothetical protein